MSWCVLIDFEVSDFGELTGGVQTVPGGGSAL